MKGSGGGMDYVGYFLTNKSKKVLFLDLNLGSTPVNNEKKKKTVKETNRKKGKKRFKFITSKI